MQQNVDHEFWEIMFQLPMCLSQQFSAKLDQKTQVISKKDGKKFVVKFYGGYLSSNFGVLTWGSF